MSLSLEEEGRRREQRDVWRGEREDANDRDSSWFGKGSFGCYSDVGGLDLVGYEERKEREEEEEEKSDASSKLPREEEQEPSSPFHPRALSSVRRRWSPSRCKLSRSIGPWRG